MAAVNQSESSAPSGALTGDAARDYMIQQGGGA